MIKNSTSSSPMHLLKSIYTNRSLIIQITRRDIFSKYKGSFLGIFWSLLNPILMLLVYTFFFSVIFQAKWGTTGSKSEFALILFSGLMIFNFLSECLNRSSVLVLQNANYVKKIIFPLEILPVMCILTALLNLFISFLVWLIFYISILGMPSLSIIMFPIILIPLIILTLGLTWLFSSLGVYVRDITQLILATTAVLLFISPIFYPIAALPADYQYLMHANPLTFTIEQARNVMMWNKEIDWNGWAINLIASIFIAILGFAWFQKTKRGFADVL